MNVFITTNRVGTSKRISGDCHYAKKNGQKGRWLFTTSSNYKRRDMDKALDEAISYATMKGWVVVPFGCGV